MRLSVRGGREYFAAFADDPLPAGSTVLVIDEGAHRTVTVVAWVDPMSFRSLD